MAIQIQESVPGKVFTVDLSGKLTRRDYELWAPQADRMIAPYKSVRMIVVMRDFHGWEAGAAWEDLKFGLKHYSHFERIAVVGDRKWESWMATFCRPFTNAQVRFFPIADLEQARQWAAAD